MTFISELKRDHPRKNSRLHLSFRFEFVPTSDPPDPLHLLSPFVMNCGNVSLLQKAVCLRKSQDAENSVIRGIKMGKRFQGRACESLLTLAIF